MDNPPLQPAVRDPKALRRTAFTLVGIMILGGVMVHLAYQKWSKNHQQDDEAARISRIVPGRELDVLRQDGTRGRVPEGSGKVWVVAAVSAAAPETAEISTGVMKRLAEHYAPDEDVMFTTLVIDPGAPEQLEAKLKAQAELLGAKLPKWTVASTEPETLHKFIKNEFKTSLYPHLENGKWVFDTSIVLIDRNRHVRNAVIPQKRGGEPYVARFDFDQAAQWDTRGVKTGTDRTNVQELERVLQDTIEQLRKEPLKD
ncbi:MAG: hypothetical protein QM755_15900 [Luteolibacter sp.]